MQDQEPTNQIRFHFKSDNPVVVLAAFILGVLLIAGILAILGFSAVLALPIVLVLAAAGYLRDKYKARRNDTRIQD